MKTHARRNRSVSVLLSVILLGSTFPMAHGQAVAGRENRSNKVSSNQTQLTKSMNQLMTNLKGTKPAGGPDTYYATLAKIHQQSGVDLAQQGARAGRDTKLVDMARQMVTQGQTDIAALNKLSSQVPTGTPNPRFNDAVSRKVRAVEMDLTNGMNGKLTGDFDKDFLAAMIQHHQDEVDLAQTYLPYAGYADLRRYAEAVVASNRKKIDVMKEMLKK